MPGGQSEIDLTPLARRTDIDPLKYWTEVAVATGLGMVALRAASRYPSVAHTIYWGRPYDGQNESEEYAWCARLPDYNTALMEAGNPDALATSSCQKAYNDARRAYLASGVLNNSAGLAEYYLRLIPAFLGRNDQSRSNPETIVDLISHSSPMKADVMPHSESPGTQERYQLTYLDRLSGMLQEAGMGFMDQPSAWRDRKLGHSLLEMAANLSNPLCSYELEANGCVTREIRRRDFDIAFFNLYMDSKDGRLKDDTVAQRRQFAKLQKQFSERFLEWGRERKRTWGEYDIGLALEWMQVLGFRHHIYSEGLIGREYVMFGTPRIERPQDGLTGRGVAKKQASDLVVVVDRQRYYIQSKIKSGNLQYIAPVIVTTLNPKVLLSDKESRTVRGHHSGRKSSYRKLSINPEQRFPDIAGQYRSFYERELRVLDPYDSVDHNPIKPFSIKSLLAKAVLQAT